MATTVAGYSHVTVVVDDLDAAVAFYRDTLGFERLPRPDTLGPGAWLQVGTAQLHIVIVDELGPPPVGLPHLALHVPPGEWDATIAALEALDVDFVRRPRSREDFGRLVRAAFIRDPAGNVIELTDVGPLPD
ncbi:MAG TPA: VOC family protein [Acidimicrobiia bacterium]|nr:VOC family protein [Acidimicrobiia bacterium]